MSLLQFSQGILKNTHVPPPPLATKAKKFAVCTKPPNSQFSEYTKNISVFTDKSQNLCKINTVT